MSEPVPAGFPVNIIGLLDERFKKNMPDHAVVQRPCRMMDPAQTLGIYPVDVDPVQSSHQIGQIEPTLLRYLVRIQNMVKSGDEAYATGLFAFDAKSVRVVLYRDPDLAVRLPLLTEELLGVRESVKRWGVGRQRFVNTGSQSGIVLVAQTDLWVETETTQL